MRRRIPLAPAEGWLTLGLVLLICLTMAWAIDDARWVLGRAQYLDYLVVSAIGGVLCGFIGPKVGWGRWLTFLMGSIFAALIVPLITGLSASHLSSIHDLYQATSDAVVIAYVDLAVNSLSSTAQYLHFILLFGIVVWATSMFASYAVFGHRRPLSAVVVVGVILVGNMSLTRNDELPFLVMFSLASLFLLIRSHVFDEQSEWLRRRIGDPASISSVYLRGGTVFIVVAVAASFLLTQTAASAPLAGAFDGVQDGLISLSRSVSRFLPTGGQTRAVGLTFGSDTQVQQVWNTDGSLAVTIHRDPTDTGPYYWRAVASDHIDLKGWSRSKANATTVDRAAGTPILDSLADNVVPLGLHHVSFTVTPGDFRGETILSPATPVEVDQPSRLTYLGTDGYFGTLERDGGSGPYTVTALTQVHGDAPGQLTQAKLRATSTDYPKEISDLYLQMAPGAMGPNAQALEAKIRADAASAAPIDLADQFVTELHDPSQFQYTTDVRNLDCASLSTVECFATFRKGFCQYYAATMAVILRDMGVPTRIAEGFLPGTFDSRSGNETILFSNAHAWVEVYFAGYGWVPFDPTGGTLSRIEPLPSGAPVASGGPRSSATIPAASRKAPVDDPLLNGGAAGPTKPTSTSLGPLLAVGALLLLVLGALSFLVWQRGPRGGTSADGAYGSVTRIASRFGFGPRPTQTVYEYAGALGDVLPTVRPELETVARAKVESVYAREILGPERVASLRAAQRRLRVGLLRLAFHRKDRRRRK